MAATKIVLILGGGPNVGLATAKLFASKAYKVALTSRSDSAADSSYFHIKSDLYQPDKIKDVFAAVKSEFGNPPNVVIYNAAQMTPTGEDPLSLSQERFEQGLAINVTSPYLAAQEAIKGFADLPEDFPKSFIYTGNGLNKVAVPSLLDLGLGKTASAHFIEAATKAYGSKGWTFYYGDERKADGGFAGMAISGPAHAERYFELSQDREQHVWLDTFVAGVGYKSLA